MSKIEAEAHRRFPAHHHDGHAEGEPLPSPVVSSAGSTFAAAPGEFANIKPLLIEGQEFDPDSPRAKRMLERETLTDHQRAGLKARGWLMWPSFLLGESQWTRAPGDFGAYAEEGDTEWNNALEEIGAQEPVPDPAQAGLAADANPKDKAALDKVPMWTLPAIGAVHGAMATGEGVRKDYGPFNWRYKPISMNEHLAAIERHILAIKDGEDYIRDAEDRQITHLGCIIAGATIILDARQCGTLVDDRPDSIAATAADELEAYHERNKR